MIMITVEHSMIRRGRRPVLEPARLSFPANATVGVVGLNGTGKSTLFLGIADLLTRRAGRFFIETELAHPTIAYMPQVPQLPRWLAVEAVAPLYGSTFPELEARCTGMRLAELRGRRVAELSGGQLQALMFALCWSRRSDITLLDEPFANLDMARRRAAVRLIHGRESGLVLLSAQAAADLTDCCDRYVVLRSGHYVFAGSTEQLLEHDGMTERAPGDPAVASPQQVIEQRLIDLLEIGLD